MSNSNANSIRESWQTSPRVIKIGKHTGRYKTSKTPIYCLTAPDYETDTVSSKSREQLLPPEEFIPDSANAPGRVTGEHDSAAQTDEWVQELSKVSLIPESTKSKPSLETRNTVDVKRFRVFSTSVSVQAREFKRKSAFQEKKKRASKTASRDLLGEEASWIASEIFSIAKTRSEEVDGPGQIWNDFYTGGLEDVAIEVDYDEIESLMGEYFQDVKGMGSDCSDG